MHCGCSSDTIAENLLQLAGSMKSILKDDEFELRGKKIENMKIHPAFKSSWFFSQDQESFDELKQRLNGLSMIEVDATSTDSTVPVEEPVAVPTEEPIADPVEEPVAVPTEEPIAVPTEEPVAAPVEEPAVVPVEEPAAVPVEEPISVPDVPTDANSTTKDIDTLPVEEPISVPTDPIDSESDSESDSTETDNLPVDEPIDTTPVEPTPVEPTPIEPTPVDPTPVEPTPVEPTPVEPTPVEPACTPAPFNPVHWIVFTGETDVNRAVDQANSIWTTLDTDCNNSLNYAEMNSMINDLADYFEPRTRITWSMAEENQITIDALVKIDKNFDDFISKNEWINFATS